MPSVRSKIKYSTSWPDRSAVRNCSRSSFKRSVIRDTVVRDTPCPDNRSTKAVSMSRVLIPATYMRVIRVSRLSVRDTYASRIFD